MTSSASTKGKKVCIEQLQKKVRNDLEYNKQVLELYWSYTGAILDPY